MVTKTNKSYAIIESKMKGLVEFSLLSEEQRNEELEKGYQDMKEGPTKSVSKVFADIHKDYNL